MALPTLSLNERANPEMNVASNSIQLVRHATLVIRLGPYKLLVDPMLSAKGALDPVKNARSTERIPLVELPFDENTLRKLIDEVDAVLVTHTHRDHWDSRAQQLIPNDKLILCQPTDVELIRSQQFQRVESFDRFTWKDLSFFRTGGQHGTGEVGKQMGTVSGIVIRYGRETIYVAGDTIWCDEVQTALEMHRPNWIVLNAGAAQFLQGGPITMTSEDVVQVCRQAPSATIVAVHMDVVSHCNLHRPDLKLALEKAGFDKQCRIPADGETIGLA